MKHRKGYRNITVNNIKWQYKISTQRVVAYSENGDKLLSYISDIVNMSPDDIEREMHKGVFHLTPKEIADWINRSL